MALFDSLAGYRPETYKRASNVSSAIGIAGLLLAIALGHDLLGFAVFALGLVAGVGIPSVSERSVYDERDEDHLAETSAIVLSVWAIGGLAVYVSIGVLESVNRVTVSSELEAAFYTWSAFWLFFTITYLFTLYRRR